jgi:hypothetical protein
LGNANVLSSHFQRPSSLQFESAKNGFSTPATTSNRFPAAGDGDPLKAVIERKVTEVNYKMKVPSYQPRAKILKAFVTKAKPSLYSTFARRVTKY